MAHIDLTPLYRSSVGFDRFGALLDSALRSEQAAASYPPYNIERTGEDRYAVTLAVAGFEEAELEIQVENGVLSIRGRKADGEQAREYLYQGIASRGFERKFNLADHVEVTGAQLANGLLTVSLKKEIPEAMRPRRINIESAPEAISQAESRAA